MRFFKKYEMRLCLQECRSRLMLETCGCVPLGFRPLTGSQSDQICDFDKSDFVEGVSDNFSYRDAEESCNCLHNCNSIDYYDYDTYRGKIRVENQTNEEYEAAPTISFADDEFVAYKRYHTHGIGEILSNIGGFLGLFLGMSVLSVVETIYFFTLRFINDLWYKPKVVKAENVSI